MLRQHCLPTPAEQARTVLRASPTLEIVAGDVTAVVAEHDVDGWGRPLLALDGRVPLAEEVVRARQIGHPLPMLVRAASLRPVEVPDRVRARVELSGYLDTVCRLGSGQVLLRGEVLAVTLDGSGVDPDAYAQAACDPHVDDEAIHLRALREHPAAVARACAQLEPELVAAASSIAPSGLDRRGVTVWLAGPGWVHELRLAFDKPMERGDDVTAAVAGLLDGTPARP